MELRASDIEHILNIHYQEYKPIKAIVEDIIYVQEQYLFVVRKGENYDGFQDIDEALKRGAIVIHECETEERGYYVEDLNEKVHQLIHLLYKNISYYFKVIGVCGTNGKSSVVSYLYDCLKEERCLKIGTHFIECQDFSYHHENTTPGMITLMHLFHLAYQYQIRVIVMEVSSHAIDQNRMQFIDFDYVMYTNIERDHVDYHKTLLHYRYTKYKLTNHMKDKGLVIANKDELYYQELKKVCPRPIISYGFEGAHFQIHDMNLAVNGSQFYVNRFFYRTSLLSKANVYNVTACIALLRMLHISYYVIYQKLLTLHALEGRLEVLQDEPYTIVLDYAHSAKAFHEVLSFLVTLHYNRLIVVVGCGGEREKEKRSEIGYYASYFCDIAIFTEDNSRNENVDNIMDDMCLRIKKAVTKIANRQEAIQYALNLAQKNDIILISGKGNETTMIKEGKIIPYNDKETINMILE